MPQPDPVILSLIATVPVLLSRVVLPGTVIHFDFRTRRLEIEVSAEILDLLVAHMKAGRLTPTDGLLDPAAILQALEPSPPPERRKRRGRRSGDIRLAS